MEANKMNITTWMYYILTYMNRFGQLIKQLCTGGNLIQTAAAGVDHNNSLAEIYSCTS